MENKKYTKAFVEFDKVSTSKDKKKLIVHVGKMMLSININYIKAIVKNLENPSLDTDGFLPNDASKSEAS
jgi:ribosomal 50S subunit-associated protein YjgA (DUF615 family)